MEKRAEMSDSKRVTVLNDTQKGCMLRGLELDNEGSGARRGECAPVGEEDAMRHAGRVSAIDSESDSGPSVVRARARLQARGDDSAGRDEVPGYTIVLDVRASGRKPGTRKFGTPWAGHPSALT